MTQSEQNSDNAPVVEILRDGSPAHALPVPPGGLTIGRNPDNDLVLADNDVSRHHCILWVQDGQLWIRDRGSRNGTFVNGRRLEGAIPIEDGDTLSLGEGVRLQVRGAPPVADRGLEDARLLVEDVVSGVRFPLRPGRSTLGGGPQDPVRLPDLPPAIATIELSNEGAVSLHHGDRSQQWSPEERLDIGGRPLRLVQVRGASPVTTGLDTDSLPYHLRVTLDGAAGPEAWLSVLPASEPVLIGTGNRAILLFLLARQLEADRAAGKAVDAAGWSSDEDLGVGVWGRGFSPADLNSLHVLIYRARKGLEAEGFDGGCLEKRRKATRLKLARVTVS